MEVPKIQGRVISGEKKAPARKPAHRRPDLGPKSQKQMYKLQGRVISEKKAPARKPAHSRPNLDKQLIFPKSSFELMTHHVLKPHAS